MAKGVYKISGNTTPKVLEKNTYKVEAWYPETPYSERDSTKVTWELFVEENGKFRTTHIKKKGIGDFTFGKNAYKHTYKIEGYLYAPEGKEPMSLVIRPQKNDGASLSNEKEILGVRLTYEDGSKITKPLSYMDRLMATAKCQNLEGRYIIFELWEDDEKGSGHNKKNQSIIKSQPIRVDIRGYASWNFTLLNTFISLAQQREGEDKKHEYYVTAEYNGKILNNSGNINVNNPTPVIKITPKSSSKSKTTASTNNPQPKPQPNSAKGSTHQGSKNNQSDDKGIITSIKITDLKGQFFKKRPKFGERIQIVIEGKSIKGKDYTLRLWEDDTTGKNDLLYERRGKFESNSQMFYVDLTEEMQWIGKIGNNSQNPDYGEYWTGNYQEIFAEVIVNTRTAQSQIISVDLKAEARKPEKTRTPTKVGETKKKEEKGTCVCKQYDLIWGNKVSCEFRKKVVEISKRQGVDANNLMAAMAHETGGTFDPTCGTFKKHKDENKEGYVGLIQIGKDAAERIAITRTELLKMSQLKQLDYVEKYLALNKGKLNTLTDFYLAILFPVDCGKGNQPNHVVFDNSLPISYKNGKPVKNINYWRNVAYSANPAFHKEGRQEKGKTYVWEIAENIQIWYDKGKSKKTRYFTCNKEAQNVFPNVDKGLWNVIVTEKYTGSQCTHIEKTPIRSNCRRGIIEVYDHNWEKVLTISDCLLEGIAGEDRTVTNSDAPFGTYQISSNPFIMGASSGDKRTSYGPNPRLSFEPIKGLGDEADISGRSLIRIHGGRQETKKFTPRTSPNLLRTHGCIRVWDSDAKRFYEWWVDYHKSNPNIKPGKLILKK